MGASPERHREPLGNPRLSRLWAGWRMSYVESAREGARECLFCRKQAGSQDRDDLILARGRTCFILLNAFPYNSGHLMVAPYRHVDSFAGLESGERDELVLLLGRAELAIRREYRPQGFNMGVNLGEAAGAGVIGHLHAHLVPRWTGDTNFMTTLADAKVMPEPLARTYERLERALASLPAPTMEGSGGG